MKMRDTQVSICRWDSQYLLMLSGVRPCSNVRRWLRHFPRSDVAEMDPAKDESEENFSMSSNSRKCTPLSSIPSSKELSEHGRFVHI